MSYNNYKLSDVAEVIRGVSFSSKDAQAVPRNGCFPVLRAGNIQGELILDSDLIWIPASIIDKHQLVKKNDIIMCTSSGSAQIVGKSAIAKNGWEGSFGAFCIGIRAKPDIVEPFYLYQFLNSPIFRNWTLSSVGANIKNIRKSELESFKLSLPSLPEQRRLASILDKADQIRRKRTETIKLLDQLLRSVFLEMFGDPVRNERGWEVLKVKDVVKKISAGWSVKGEERSRKNNEFGVLKISSVTLGEFNPNEHKAVNNMAIKKHLIFPKKGDLLISRANTRELVAASCLVLEDQEFLFLPDKIWKVELDEKRIFNSYLKFLLSEDKFRDRIRSRATGTSGSMLNISQGKFLNLDLAVPPIELQKRFSDVMWKIFGIKNKLREAKNSTADLFGVLTQRAFWGEL